MEIGHATILGRLVWAGVSACGRCRLYVLDEEGKERVVVSYLYPPHLESIKAPSVISGKDAKGALVPCLFREGLYCIIKASLRVTEEIYLSL